MAVKIWLLILSKSINMNQSKPVKGRPRSSAARQAIIAAFIEGIKAQGYSKLSIDTVAKMAGVSRSTIYRWYKDKPEIALDAATDYALATSQHALSGDFSTDFLEFLRQTFAVGNEMGAMYTVLMAESQAKPEFAQKVWNQYSLQRRQRLQAIIEQNSNQATGVAMEVVLDMVFGAIWYRLMSHHASLDQAFAEQLRLSVSALLDV